MLVLVLLRGAEGRGVPVPVLGRGGDVLFRAPALPVPNGFLADGRLGEVFFGAFQPVPHTMQNRSLRALFVSH
ncbi:hypothetical protein [Streptomyces angustmyceticus]|uniref:hypothetical protein n=1 Tax=Streptomyces angustmyceticus TaxID=285578 RepID=UPI00382D63DF